MSPDTSRPKNRSNVLFEASTKEGEYEKLDARIQRRRSLVPSLNLVDNPRTGRSVLYQYLWYRDTSFTERRLHTALEDQGAVGVFLWFAVDEVGRVLIDNHTAHCSQHIYSIIPCLALRGVADGIARSRSLKAKILLRASKPSVDDPR